MAYVYSIVSALVVTTIAVLMSLFNLRLRGKVASDKLLTLVLVVAIFNILLGNIVSRINLLGSGNLLLTLAGNLIFNYFVAKNYLRFDENLARRFSLYLTISVILVAFFLGLILYFLAVLASHK